MHIQVIYKLRDSDVHLLLRLGKVFKFPIVLQNRKSNDHKLVLLLANPEKNISENIYTQELVQIDSADFVYMLTVTYFCYRQDNGGMGWQEEGRQYGDYQEIYFFTCC